MSGATIRPAGEDTRDGGVLTDAMVAELGSVSPGTNPAACRYHEVTDTALVITCDDGTSLEWS